MCGSAEVCRGTLTSRVREFLVAVSSKLKVLGLYIMILAPQAGHFWMHMLVHMSPQDPKFWPLWRLWLQAVGKEHTKLEGNAANGSECKMQYDQGWHFYCHTVSCRLWNRLEKVLPPIVIAKFSLYLVLVNLLQINLYCESFESLIEWFSWQQGGRTWISVGLH